jgi:hypothetical protein
MMQVRDGNVWFSAWHNHRIKVIDGSGMLTTYAGSSDLFGGYQGDNLKGARAQFNLPSSFAWDDSTTNGVWTPNMYISDQGNFRIRRVNPDTIVTTYAGGFDFTGFEGDGGTALSARFSAPRGPDAVPCFRLDVDRANRKVYIADSHNNRVRVVDMNTNVITTFAGKGPSYPSVPGYTGDGGPATDAEINFPTDVAVAPNGLVYICDSYNNVIRRVDPATGIITTVAGTGQRGYSGDGGPATQAQLNHPNGIYATYTHLFIADTENSRIRRLRLP